MQYIKHYGGSGLVHETSIYKANQLEVHVAWYTLNWTLPELPDIKFNITTPA